MNYLVLIAIGAYRHWRPLRGPSPDADALREVLFAQYGFAPERTVELRDAQATGENILQVFRQLKTASADDQLLIYYAGHGYTDEFDRTGFWIPHDAGTDRLQRLGWVPNTSVRGTLTALPFRHILLVCDSCFSGDLLDEQRDLGVERTPDFVLNAQRMRSREILASGASEPVADANLGGHSEFAFHLVETLKTCPDEWVDPLRIYDHVRNGVRGQQPLYGCLSGTGHQRGGSFILQRQMAWQPPPVPAFSAGTSSRASSSLQPAATGSLAFLFRMVRQVGLIGLTMFCMLVAAFQTKRLAMEVWPSFMKGFTAAMEEAGRSEHPKVPSARAVEPAAQPTKTAATKTETAAPEPEPAKPPPAVASTKATPAPTAATVATAPKAPEPAPPPVLVKEITLTVKPAECQPRVTVGSYNQKEVAAGQPEKLELISINSPLTVSAKGYLTKTITVDLSQPNRDFEVQLEPVVVEVLVETNPESKVRFRPAGKTEWVDCGLTDSQGQLQRSQMQVGRYDFELSKIDHESHLIRDYELQAGKTASLKWELRPMPGQLRVRCEPDGADIWLDGNKLTEQTPAVLEGISALKQHQLRVGKNGYQMVSQNVTLKPAETLAVDFGALNPITGDLRLKLANSELPDWREIRLKVDGQEIAAANGLAKGLDSGDRVVEVEHADYELWRGKVTVTEGRTRNVDVELKPKPGKLALQVESLEGAVISQYRLTESGREVQKQEGYYWFTPLHTYNLVIEAGGYVSTAFEATFKPNQTLEATAKLNRAAAMTQQQEMEQGLQLFQQAVSSMMTIQAGQKSRLNGAQAPAPNPAAGFSFPNLSAPGAGIRPQAQPAAPGNRRIPAPVRGQPPPPK